MKNILFFSALCLMAGCATAPHVSFDVIYQDSRPQKAAIYSNGDVVLEDRVENGRIVNNTLALPLTLDLNSVAVYENEQRVKYYTIEKKTVAVRNADGKPSAAERYLIAFPNRDAGKPLLLRYSVNGISWEPRLDIELREGKKIQLYLNAIINPGKNLLNDCDITLVYSGSAITAGSEADKHHIGKLDLAGNQLAYYLLDSQAAEYQSYYAWHVGDSPEAISVMAFRNPLRSGIGGFKYALLADNIVINEGRIPASVAQDAVELSTSFETRLVTFSSVTTKEDINKKILAFNHSLVYSLQNNLDSPVTVRVYFRKKIGTTHRNVYHFTVEPDAMPGPFFVWQLKLTAGEKKEIAFNFDSDDKDFQEYSNYNSSDIGR